MHLCLPTIHCYSVSSITFSLTSPTTAQLLWEEDEQEEEEEEQVQEEKEESVKVENEEEQELEELDYDETMEDLDLHPTGNIDEGGGDESQKLCLASELRTGKSHKGIYQTSDAIYIRTPNVHLCL